MPSILFDLAVIAAVLYCAWLGYDKGFVICAAVAAQLLACSFLSLLLFEFLAGPSLGWFEEAARLFIPDGFDSQGWFVFLFLAGLMWLPIVALYIYILPELQACDFQTFPLVDRIGGGIAGGFTGYVAIGMVLVTLSACPLAAVFPIPVQRMVVEPGSWLLAAVGGFARDYNDGKSVVIYGEPAQDLTGVNTLIAKENWVDRDGDGKFDSFVDVFYDVDGSESYTEELRFDDLDSDQSRRIGLIEKYKLARWNYDLLTDAQTIRRKTPAPNQEPETPTVVATETKPAAEDDPLASLLAKPRRLDEENAGDEGKADLPKPTPEKPDKKQDPLPF